MSGSGSGGNVSPVTSEFQVPASEPPPSRRLAEPLELPGLPLWTQRSCQGNRGLSPIYASGMNTRKTLDFYPGRCAGRESYGASRRLLTEGPGYRIGEQQAVGHMQCIQALWGNVFLMQAVRESLGDQEESTSCCSV
ncbi:hypothetical protein NDU88_005509 [Pleurodeles waltl]|uniref:Uncharacterized protein n=1 Tax=Pleurodeles waltl TaxID=8319 RepID=A0AAV7PJ29_PLEWA|nr:hypothetical protein NDU88_005509 [Pleurodeles waltl]